MTGKALLDFLAHVVRAGMAHAHALSSVMAGRDLRIASEEAKGAADLSCCCAALRRHSTSALTTLALFCLYYGGPASAQHTIACWPGSRLLKMFRLALTPCKSIGAVGRLLSSHLFIILHSQAKCINLNFRGTEETAGLHVAQSCRICRQTSVRSGAGLCSHMLTGVLFASAPRQTPAWIV